MNLHQQEENDDKKAVLSALQAIVFRSRQMRRTRRHPASPIVMAITAPSNP